MVHVAFKTVQLVNPTTEEKGDFSYRESLLAAIHHPLDGRSMDFDEILRSTRLVDAIEKGNDKGADFEDADFEYLVTKVQAMRFKFDSKALLQFRDDILNSKTAKL